MIVAGIRIESHASCARYIDGTMITDIAGDSDVEISLAGCSSKEFHVIQAFLKGMEEGSRFKRKTKVHRVYSRC